MRVGVVGVLVLVLGCGPGTSSSGPAPAPTPTPVTASAFCQQVEALNVKSVMQCYGGKTTDWSIFYGQSECPSLDAAVNDNRLSYDVTKAAACLNQLAQPVACSADAPEGPTCVVSVLVGGVADGEPCDSTYVCHPGSSCTFVGEIVDSCPAMTCQHVPVAGEKCATLGGFSTCAFGASCLAGTCVANAKVGTPCGQMDDAACGQNLYCATADPVPECKRNVQDGPCTPAVFGGLGCFDYQFCDSTGRCRFRLVRGADCSSNPTGCESFTACDPDTHRCVQASHVGELCGDLLGYPFLCQGGSCQADANQVSHCVVPLTDGAACANDFECASTFCAAGKCAERPPNDGAPCTDDTLCASGKCSAAGTCGDGSTCLNGALCTSGLCTAGVCVAKAPNGSTCAQAGECQSGACLAGMCVPQAADGAGCADGTDCMSGHCAAGKCAVCM
jgi:hypothetical protein